MTIQPQPTSSRPNHSKTVQRALETLDESKSADINQTYAATREYVYVVGDINAHFPNLSVEKEYYQACVLSGVDASRLKEVNDDVALARLNQEPTLNEILYQGLSQSQNSYVAREMNWLFCNVDNNELYTLITDSDDSLLQFVAALGLKDEQVILQGEVQQDGRVLVSNLIPVNSTPVNKSQIANAENQHKKELVDEIRSLNANDGMRNDERALNYTLYNNQSVYKESFQLCYKANSGGPNPNGYQLVNVEIDTSWNGDRLVSKLIFNYQGINTGAKQSWYTTVDVTGEYPFLLTEWKRFLPRY
ncbi:hypothetical protein ACFFUP_12965 [Vibrio ostreicida]|uniref:PatG C-terminal domain-containing protein n=1 Tax=Vibrio ostreicida TaxID=526588 RepID=A0ABT8BYS5_9VIBR|nr:hypothetical protein [Vibrio ostreicida]MDN3611526.1 hypothetical protein [Vibrio ostreicida]NPD09021.1 hypothetical protein [Vibrio ostreicida]